MDLIKACESEDFGKAVLIWGFQNKLTEFVLELVKIVELAKPGQVNNYDYAALFDVNEMTEIALELIKTGYGKPEQIGLFGDTALIFACKNGMKDVAYELVSIGAFTINDIMSLKPEWIPEELFIMNPVDVTEVDI